MPRIADAEARKRVLRTASELFYARGIQAVGMNEIISSAGCGKSLVYAHFPSKADLVAEYMDRFLRARERVAADAAAKAGDDPRAQVMALTAELIARTRTGGYRGCAARNYLVEFPDAGSDDAAAVIARDYLRRTKRDLLQRVKAAGVADPAGVTEQIWLVHEGLYSPARQGSRRTAEQAATALVAQLLTDRATSGRFRRPEVARSGDQASDTLTDFTCA